MLRLPKLKDAFSRRVFLQKLNIVYHSFSIPIFLKSNVNINTFVESVENAVAHWKLETLSNVSGMSFKNIYPNLLWAKC